MKQLLTSMPPARRPARGFWTVLLGAMFVSTLALAQPSAPDSDTDADAGDEATQFEAAHLRAGAPLMAYQLIAPGSERIIGFLGALGVGAQFRTSKHLAVAIDVSPSPLDTRLGVEVDYAFSGWANSGAVGWSGVQYGVGSLRCRTSECDVTEDADRYWAVGPSVHVGLGYRWVYGQNGDIGLTLGLASSLAHYTVVHAPDGIDAVAFSGLYYAPFALRYLVSW